MSPDHLIEVSFEIGNKVGGIHQVIKSKAQKMQDFYGNNYLAIGYYEEESAREEFIPREDVDYDIPQQLENKGLEVYSGVWDVEGKPRTILVDVSDYSRDIDEIKQELWDEYGIDSLGSGHEFEDPVKWAYAVGEIVKSIEENHKGSKVLHTHEWLSAPAIFNSDMPSVFTTHATVLGRALSNSDFDLRSAVKDGFVDDGLAEEMDVKTKHQTEKAAAEAADVFTTVSKVTGEEAEAVLDQKPDVILPNGFNVEDFPSLEELSYQHTRKKEQMKDFLRAYFEPYYDVNLEDDPRIIFTSGRYEFHNKGLDVFIDALGELNRRDGEELFAFIFVPSGTVGPKQEVLENMSLYEELDDFIESRMPEIKKKAVNAVTSGEDPAVEVADVIRGGSDISSLQRKFHDRKGGSPALCAFDLDYPHDSIIERLMEQGLMNRESDRVKVVFYPSYLSMGDRMLSMDYNDAIVASSAGIFPSYYEPWGYTPVETAANGALSVTTDLAGFGEFLKEKTSEEDRKGIKILERKGVADEEVSEKLADLIEDISRYSRTEITEMKHNARKLAQLTSWEEMGENYRKAHEKATGERR